MFNEMHQPKCMGFMALVIGVVVIVNQVKGFFAWPILIGLLLVLKCLMLIFMPVCGCLKSAPSVAAPSKQTRKR